MKAKHPAQADGHVGVAGKVKVDLKGIAQRAQPGEGHGQADAHRPPGGVGNAGQLVGQQYLLPQPHHEPAAPGGEIRPVLPAVEDLFRDGGVFDDGPGDELGKEGDIQPQVRKAALDTGLAPGHVKDVAHGLEGKKGDADGQANDRNGDRKTQPAQVG